MAELDAAGRDGEALAPCPPDDGRTGESAWARARSISTTRQQDTLYRIHGTNEPETIGRAASSGCIRMRNIDVVDLYNRVPVGAKVIVR